MAVVVIVEVVGGGEAVVAEELVVLGGSEVPDISGSTVGTEAEAVVDVVVEEVEVAEAD